MVALVVGASSGIGRASALRLAARGARLTLCSRSQEALEAAATECRAAGATDVVPVALDIRDQAAFAAVVSDVVARFGRLDVVVHTAATMAYGRIEDVPAEVFESVVDSTIHGTANLARVVLPVFRHQGEGSLVIVSSLLASISAPTMGSYVTAKWGQLGLIRTLQIETRDAPDIHVSAVSPGGVNTPIYFQAATYTGSTGRPPPPVYSADRVAKAVVRRIDRPRRLKQSGIANPLILAGFRLLPVVFDPLVGPLLGLFGMARDTVAPTGGNVLAPTPGGEATDGRWRSI